MRSTEHGDVIAEREGVVARVLAGADGVQDAVRLLDAAESVVAVPLVDEAERARLEALAAGREERASHWHSVLARRDGVAVGYAGVLLPHELGGLASGDVAVARDRPPCGPALSVLLASLEGLAWQHAAGRLQVWIRHATAPDVACATDDGYGVDRRLGVLGRGLDDLAEVTLPEGVTIRSYQPGVDDEAVVSVLCRAYIGTDDGGWTVERFRQRTAYDWFEPDDLLVADRGGGLAGIHWTKRRGSGVGEVYNLAIDPAAQGGGLGAALLDAGLRHLADAGCTDVLLWVDLANERAVRLYSSQGFHTRWEDIALGRTLRGTRRDHQPHP